MTGCQTVISTLFTWARNVLQLLSSPLWERAGALSPTSVINSFTSWEMEGKATGKGKRIIPCDAGDKVMDALAAKHFLTFVSNKSEFVGGRVLD